MKKIEAPTLEEAYKKACQELECSMTELQYEVVQYPSKGFLGLFGKSAVIVVSRTQSTPPVTPPTTLATKDNSTTSQEIDNQKDITPQQNTKDTATDSNIQDIDSTDISKSESEIMDRFFGSDESSSSDFDNEELANLIKDKIVELIESSCFKLDTVDVVIDNNTAHIYIDGEDAALMIGKEGYRYNALSYLLYNWINSKYGLSITLEIAEFLKSQKDMIRNYLQPLIATIEEEGEGRTKNLDGVLIQIALEELRERFPNKFVAVKRSRDGGRYIVVHEFRR